MKVKSLLVFAGPILVVSLTALPAAGQDDPPRWIPFETTSQSALPIVAARLNGSEGYRLVLDPSVREVLLDIFLIEGAGMKLLTEGEQAVIDYYGFEETVPVVYLETLDLGGVVKRVVRTLIIKGDDSTSLEGIPSYGRIGREFLEPFRLTVHYPRKLLLLEPSPKDEVPPGGVPFESGDRSLSVSAQVNGRLEGRFIIDPAASVTMIDQKWARREGLVTEGERMAELSSLQVGGFVAEQVVARLGEMRRLPDGGRSVGVIGATLLRRLAVTYDFPRSLVWLRHGEKSP